MRVIDCLCSFAANVRGLSLRLSSAQVLLALAAGRRLHRGIVAVCGLHENTVTNILQRLIDQGFVGFGGTNFRRRYFLTPDGEREVRMLMRMDRVVCGEEEEEEELSCSEERVLFSLFRGHCCVVDLVRDTSISTSQIRNIARKLILSKLVSSSPSMIWPYRTIYALTTEGKQAVASFLSDKTHPTNQK